MGKLVFTNQIPPENNSLFEKQFIDQESSNI